MWLYRLNFRPMGRVFGLYWRLRLEGAVRSIPKQGPLILAANHASFLDPWLLSMCFPRCIRYLIDWEWYFKSAFWHGLFRAYGTIPVHPSDADKTIRIASAALDGGSVVGIFPEGGISYDGKMTRFRSGISRVAARSGAPVLPLGIRGSFRTLPRTRRFPRPCRVTIHVGEPMRFPESPRRDNPRMSEIRAFQGSLVREVRRLADQA